MANLPNLFVIGAMKAGTTSLCEYLGAHRDVYMSAQKETYFFSRASNHLGGPSRYLKFFAKAADRKFVAEGSTEYAKRPFTEGVAERIHGFNPNSRIIYLVRDPLDRLVSQYKHMVKNGRESESLASAILRRSDYVTNSYYAYQLAPYVALFGRSAVHVARFEELTVDPLGVCQRIFRWLEIDDSFVPPNIEHVFNVGASGGTLRDGRSLAVGLVRSLRQSRTLREWAPLSLKRFVLGRLPKGDFIDFRTESFQLEVKQAGRNLAPLFRVWSRELTAVTGEDYSSWPSVAGSIGGDYGDFSPSGVCWLPDDVERSWRESTSRFS
jgi:hypothetical protein